MYHLFNLISAFVITAVFLAVFGLLVGTVIYSGYTNEPWAWAWVLVLLLIALIGGAVGRSDARR